MRWGGDKERRKDGTHVGLEHCQLQLGPLRAAARGVLRAVSAPRCCVSSRREFTCKG